MWVDTRTEGSTPPAGTLARPPRYGGANDIGPVGATTGCQGTQAGVATTTAINITGGSGLNATTDQDAHHRDGDVPDGEAQETLAATQANAPWGAINWTVSLGAETRG